LKEHLTETPASSARPGFAKDSLRKTNASQNTFPPPVNAEPSFLLFRRQADSYRDTPPNKCDRSLLSCSSYCHLSVPCARHLCSFPPPSRSHHSRHSSGVKVAAQKLFSTKSTLREASELPPNTHHFFRSFRSFSFSRPLSKLVFPVSISFLRQLIHT
jgi:hypothetical protein